MTPSTPQPHVIAYFRSLVWQSLDNDMLPTALFAAERLSAYDPKGGDSVHLLSLCLYRDGQYLAAESLTKSWVVRHLGCAYIYAQCCLKLGDGRESQGINALEACRRYWIGTSTWDRHSDTDRRSIPDAATVHFLLGRLWHNTGDVKKSVDSYVAALKLNPFAWEAFTGLCDTGILSRANDRLGVNLRPNAVFKQSQEMLESLKIPSYPSHPSNIPPTIPEESSTLNGLRNSSENLPSDPFSANGGSSRDRSDLSFNNHPSFFNRLNEGVGSGLEAETPTSQPTGSSSHELFGGNGLNTADKPPPVRKTRATTTEVTTRKLTSRSTREVGNDGKRSAASSQESGPQAPARRSTRLTSKFTSKLGVGAERETRLGTKEREREAKKAKTVASRSRSLHLTGASAAAKERQKERERDTSEDINMSDAASKPTFAPGHQIDIKKQEAQLFMLDLFKKAGAGYFSLSRFRCKEALHALNSLSLSQKDTPWVQSQIGRAHYEMANYVEAEKCFLRVRNLSPVRTRDMEVFSTILWHQRKEVDLSYLAHELVELDRLSPEAWCALGNCFSLQRDHDQALKCFKRATQLNPKLAYAFTLQGHEHVSNEEYEKALASYRSAITADSRHYNAWYGLGKVFEKMGKFDTAEKHFRTASKINPTNAVLVCCVGMVMEKNKDFRGALHQYNIACEMSPTSALSRFKKARTLMLLKSYQPALKELRILKDLAPDEANVHYLLGRLHKLLHDKKSAIKHFTIALNLDPKAGHLIKEAIENLDEDEDDEYSGDAEENRFLDH
ncbi:hypothetical protein B9Z19DRAFT_1098323 [Tuber borchii]|uniref:TPR-like protein n=1 Tax=Tuber borchii TaxID=42251 RepID=A0A2T7A8L6_TUBBO|nr:hypothetical protein B9Z19DRAFT_1098323 [Tuber borchii]